MSTHNLCFEQNKKKNLHPCKPQFYCIKVGFKGVKIIQACFRDAQRFFHFATKTCCGYSFKKCLHEELLNTFSWRNKKNNFPDTSLIWSSNDDANITHHLEGRVLYMLTLAAHGNH